MLLHKINKIFLFPYKHYAWTERLFIIKFEMEHCLSNPLPKKGFLPDFSLCWISMLLYKINNIFLFPYKMLLYKIINNIFLFHYKQYSWTEWLFIIKFEMEHCLSNALHRNGFSAITDVHLLNDYGRKTSPFPE